MDNVSRIFVAAGTLDAKVGMFAGQMSTNSFARSIAYSGIRRLLWPLLSLGGLVARGDADGELDCTEAGGQVESKGKEGERANVANDRGKSESRFRSDEGIELASVRVKLGTRTVLNLSLGPLRERRVAVIGRNGSGKSTLLRLLNGLVDCTQGAVYVDGVSVKAHKPQVRQHVGFVFQDPDAQIVMPTVEEEMQLGLKALRLEVEERQRRGSEALQRFGLQGREADSPHLLSGGEKQRLALACIYAMGPRILVMDEPSTMLDLPGRLEPQRLISELPQRVVIATHDLELIQVFERVLVLDEGKLISDTTDPDSAIDAYKQCIAERCAIT